MHVITLVLACVFQVKVGGVHHHVSNICKMLLTMSEASYGAITRCCFVLTAPLQFRKHHERQPLTKFHTMPKSMQDLVRKKAREYGVGQQSWQLGKAQHNEQSLQTAMWTNFGKTHATTSPSPVAIRSL